MCTFIDTFIENSLEPGPVAPVAQGGCHVAARWLTELTAPVVKPIPSSVRIASMRCLSMVLMSAPRFGD
jgi:hypothetical protein